MLNPRKDILIRPGRPDNFLSRNVLFCNFKTKLNTGLLAMKIYNKSTRPHSRLGIRQNIIYVLKNVLKNVF